jgi:hypothetical protein
LPHMARGHDAVAKINQMHQRFIDRGSNV